MELQLTPREERKMNNKTRQAYFQKGLIPAAVHGKSVEDGPCFVSLKNSRHWHRGSLFDVSWGGKNFKASIDELQHDPVSNRLVHVSFQLVGKNEVTHFDVPFKITGTSPGEKEGAMVHLQMESVTLSGKPDDMPEYIEIDVSDLHAGDKFCISDITPPSGCTWYQQDESQPIATCAMIKTQVEEETPVEATENVETEAGIEPPVDTDKEAA